MKRVSWINLILGIWLIISAFVFGSMGLRAPVANDIVLGILLIASSWWILATLGSAVGLGWFQILCGIWLVISPFILRYGQATHAMTNDVVVGIIVFIVGIVETQAMVRRPVGAA
jgi:SPW repeat-containing protein